MVAAAVEVKERLYHPAHPGVALSVVERLAHLVRHPLKHHQTIHIHHLLLDHDHLPIELVEYDMDEVEYIPSSVDTQLNWSSHR